MRPAALWPRPSPNPSPGSSDLGSVQTHPSCRRLPVTTTTSVQAYTDRRDFTRARKPPLWEGRRGQIANLWLYAYCALLSPFILPLFYAAWRAVHTFWPRYELLPDRLRITTGLYRPHIHTEKVDFDTVQNVRVEGFRLHALVHRGGCGARSQRPSQPRAHRGHQEPRGPQDPHRRDTGALAPASGTGGTHMTYPRLPWKAKGYSAFRPCRSLRSVSAR